VEHRNPSEWPDGEFNKQATRRLGIWIDSGLSFKDHHQTMVKKARNAQQRMRRLTGRMGLVPENVRRIQVACVQVVDMYGSELWWKGEKENGTTGRANDLQILVKQQARDITGCFKSTNQGELMPLSGLRPEHSLLNHPGRKFALRMATLPEGGQAGERNRGSERNRQTSGLMAGGHREARNDIPGGGHPAQGGRHRLRPRRSEN